MKGAVLKLLSIFLILLVCPAFGYSQDRSKSRITSSYDEENDTTTVFLRVIPLPQNKRKFAVGGFYHFEGKVLKKQPCCVTIAFTSIGKKNFEYKVNHTSIFWTDKEDSFSAKLNGRSPTKPLPS